MCRVRDWRLRAGFVMFSCHMCLVFCALLRMSFLPGFELNTLVCSLCSARSLLEVRSTYARCAMRGVCWR